MERSADLHVGGFSGCIRVESNYLLRGSGIDVSPFFTSSYWNLLYQKISYHSTLGRFGASPCCSPVTGLLRGEPNHQSMTLFTGTNLVTVSPWRANRLCVLLISLRKQTSRISEIIHSNNGSCMILSREGHRVQIYIQLDESSFV